MISVKPPDGYFSMVKISEKLGVNYPKIRLICENDHDTEVIKIGKRTYYSIDWVEEKLKEFDNLPNRKPKGFETLDKMHKHLGISLKVWKRYLSTHQIEPDAKYVSFGAVCDLYRINKIVSTLVGVDLGAEECDKDSPDEDEYWPIPKPIKMNKGFKLLDKVFAGMVKQRREDDESNIE